MPLCLARHTSSEVEWAATNRLETMVEVCLFLSCFSVALTNFEGCVFPESGCDCLQGFCLAYIRVLATGFSPLAKSS